MHDKPITADQLHAQTDRQFEAVFGPPPATEEERREYARYVRKTSDDPLRPAPTTFAAWRTARVERGNREGQNHD